MKGIHKSSLLETDWKNLRGYYQRLTKTKISDDDGSEVRRVRTKNCVSYGLLDTMLNLILAGPQVSNPREWARYPARKEVIFLFWLLPAVTSLHHSIVYSHCPRSFLATEPLTTGGTKSCPNIEMCENASARNKPV